MAGDWIKMRTDLADDPAVVSIAGILDADEDLIVGKLHRLWSWANRQTTDGNAIGVTYQWLDRYVGVTGFCEALETVGWMQSDTNSVTIPNFDRHNSQSAKRRALTARRVAKSRNARSVTPALPEKRREEKSKKEPPLPPFGEIEFPDGFDTPAVRGAITEWLDYKRRRGERYKQSARQMSKLLRQDWCVSPEVFVGAVNHSIASNYAGCFPARKGGQRGDDRRGGHASPARIR